MTRLERTFPTCHRWLAALRAAALETARELEVERLVWARTWGLRKALQAAVLLGCDLRRAAPEKRSNQDGNDNAD